MNFVKEFRERNIRKYFTIYLSACVTLIGLVHLFSLRYNLPKYIFNTALVFILFGILNIFFLAWYHGREGRHKIKIGEYFFHILVIGLAITTSILLSGGSSVNILSLNSKTIAVLPFTNMGDSEDDEYFSDGITEDILTQLSKISTLHVISKTSIMKYKKNNLTIPEIGRELGAGSILEGSVRRSGNKLKITGQLINSNNDELIWAQVYNRKVDDIFEVQTDIAKHIANELEAKLAPKEELLINITPTNNIEAYALCLKGRDFAKKYTDQDNEKAIEYYKKALNIDPNYALAYASLASAYDQKVRRYYYNNSWRDSAIDMSKKSLALDPNLAEGHSSLAKSFEAKQDFKLAISHYEEAIRLNSNYYAAIYNLGVVYLNNGSLEKAYPLIKKSILLEPDNVFGYIVIGGIYQKLNCDSLAIEWFQKALKLDPNNLLAHAYLVEQYILMNKIETADKQSKILNSISSDWAFGITLSAKLELLKNNYRKSKDLYDRYFEITELDKEYDYAYILLKLDMKKEANSIIQNELSYYKNEIEQSDEKFSLNDKNVAEIYGILGNTNLAMKWMKNAVNNGWFEFRQNLIYPYLDSLKNLTEFQSLVKTMKTKTDSIKAIAMSKDPEWARCK